MRTLYRYVKRLEAAVNAVFFNKIQEKPEAERAAYVAQLREEYKKDIDIEVLASELKTLTGIEAVADFEWAYLHGAYPPITTR